MSDPSAFDDSDDSFSDDQPWIVQIDDDQLSLIPPHDAIEALVTGISDFARSPHPDLVIGIEQDDAEAALDAGQLNAVLGSCADIVAYVLRRGLMDDDELEALHDAVATLSTVGGYDLELRFRDGAPDVAQRVRWVDALDHLGENCASMLFTRFRPRRDGSFTVRWRPADRELIGRGVEELRSLLGSDDPALARLFPAPYGDDDERNAGWNVLARSELIERRIAALETVEALMGRRRASADELATLMRTINDARLVFGTQLGIDDDGPGAEAAQPNTPDADPQLMMIFELLGAILFDAVKALRTTLT